MGCDNVANSGMAFNDCGYCIDSSRTDFATYGMDCTGKCNGGYVYDECGDCKAESDSTWNECVVCLQPPFHAMSGLKLEKSIFLMIYCAVSGLRRSAELRDGI